MKLYRHPKSAILFLRTPQLKTLSKDKKEKKNKNSIQQVKMKKIGMKVFPNDYLLLFTLSEQLIFIF